jgi:hypothetical protein
MQKPSLQDNRSRAPYVWRNISTCSHVPMLEANLVVSSSHSNVDISLPSERLYAHSDALKRRIRSVSKDLASSALRVLSASKHRLLVAKMKDPPGKKKIQSFLSLLVLHSQPLLFTSRSTASAVRSPVISSICPSTALARARRQACKIASRDASDLQAAHVSPSGIAPATAFFMGRILSK